MNFKKFKRIVSGCCAAIMIMSSFVISVAAEGEAGVDFSLIYWDYFNNWTKSLDLSEFTKTVDLKELNSKREDVIKRLGKASETVKIDENYTYNELLGIVQNLISRVDETTPEHKNYLGVPGDNLDKPREWRIAKDIYSWVIDNIKYDYESVHKDENGEAPFRKPQDALFVYSQRKGICLGKANLLNLMMRMAKIPSVVINSPKHSYNAIYLKHDNDKYSGWTFLDATHGALNSDPGYVEQAGQLIKGEVGAYRCWVQNIFKRDNAYTKAVENLTMIPKNMEKNDKSVNELNVKIKDGLSNLNNNVDNDFHFTDIKVVMSEDKDSKWFVLKYQTDLDYDRAENIHEELKMLAKNKAFERAREITVCPDGSGKFDDFSNEQYLKINEHQGKAAYRSREYINKLNNICVNIHKRYKVNEIEKNIEGVTKDINTEIEKLNVNFKDIVTIKSVELEVIRGVDDMESNEAALLIKLKSNLTFDDFNKVDDKILNDQKIKRKEEFFPAFYHYKMLPSEYVNKSMIRTESNYDITEISSGTIHNLHNKDINLESKYILTIDGVKYKRYIDEKGKSYIYVDVEDENRNNVVKIAPDVEILRMPLKIGYRIKSLKLIGGQTVDLSGAIRLTNVDVSDSDKYEGYDKENRKLINKGEGYDKENRKLINKGEGLVQPKKDGTLSQPEKVSVKPVDFKAKKDEFFAALGDFDEFRKSKGIDTVVGYDYGLVTKCCEFFKEVYDSNYSAEKVKEAEALMDKAIEQVNQYKQKLSNDCFIRFNAKKGEFFAAFNDFNEFRKSKGIDEIDKCVFDILNNCWDFFDEVELSNYSPEKVKEAESLVNKAIEQVNQYKQKLSANN